MSRKLAQTFKGDSVPIGTNKNLDDSNEFQRKSLHFSLLLFVSNNKFCFTLVHNCCFVFYEFYGMEVNDHNVVPLHRVV